MTSDGALSVLVVLLGFLWDHTNRDSREKPRRHVQGNPAGTHRIQS